MTSPLLFVSVPNWWLPEDASAHGLSLDRHLLLNLWIAASLLTLLHLVLFIGLALRRQPSPRPVVAAFVEFTPLILITVLFAALTIRAERLWGASRYIGSDPAALQVEATGMQFAWYFRYPGPDYTFGRTASTLIAPGEGNPVGIDPSDPRGTDDVVTSELVLPLGREVDLHLRAQDVIHGFAVPELRLKQNAIPGQTFHIHFTPTKSGRYAVLCTQLCGLGHYRMAATLRVVPPDEFTRWLAQKEETR